MDIDTTLRQYIEEKIIPRYDAFDKAHQRTHVEAVIRESLKLAAFYDVNINMVYAIAAYHDIGLCEGREHHHTVSARLIRADQHLIRWFTPEQILTMAEAAEDHRASNGYPPRSIYGKIVAEADKELHPIACIRRTVQYNIAHHPDLDFEGKYQQVIEHLQHKYAEGGYAKLWIPESDNAKHLEALRYLIRHEEELRPIIEKIMTEEEAANSLSSLCQP